MASAKSSLIWDHFREVGDIVSCNQCPKTYKLATAKSSTQPLWYHLKTKHGVLPRKRSLNDRDGALPPVVKKQRTITTYIEKKTQQQMYAELAASDRFSFGQIANSDFIRDAMRKNQFQAHISPHTVRKKVFEFYEEARTAVKAHLQKEVEAGKRFAVSFDEYTGKNRRYLTVNVHSSDGSWFNLGMVRVWSSQTSCSNSSTCA
jgi:hypothetical protein